MIFPPPYRRPSSNPVWAFRGRMVEPFGLARRVRCAGDVAKCRARAHPRAHPQRVRGPALSDRSPLPFLAGACARCCKSERLEPSTIQGGLMRRVGLLLAAALAAAVFAYPASGERGSWNNWHVHDGTAVPYTDASGLTAPRRSVLSGGSSARAIFGPRPYGRTAPTRQTRRSSVEKVAQKRPRASVRTSPRSST